jgi:tRNA-dihydrouridine synthase
VRVAEKFLGHTPIVELNCGCPQPTCLGKGAGSGLLADPEAFFRVLDKITRALGGQRVAVKMRLGIARAEEVRALADVVRAVPLARLTVHGRTRLERYGGKACWRTIADAAARAGVATWGSGDVLGQASLASARDAAPLLVGAYVGRGALRNPWVFAEIAGGRAISLTIAALAHALMVFALLSELVQVAPAKLYARLANGRVGAPCGTDSERWERLAAQLSELLWRAPFTALSPRSPRAPRISAQTEARVAVLWRYLRSSLPIELAGTGRLPRQLGDITQDLFAAAARSELDAVTLHHRAENDVAFAGGGGLAEVTA